MSDDSLLFSVNGVATPARPGQSLAAALLSAGIRVLRRSPRAGGARGAFCMMGICQECLVEVDGRAVQACMTRVAAGMAVVVDP
jgi:D-hydroxyproline dehydrogenase subunit gamma